MEKKDFLRLENMCQFRFFGGRELFPRLFTGESSYPVSQ